MTLLGTGPPTAGPTRSGTPTPTSVVSFPLLLAELRRRQALGPGSRVVAVHLGHHNPPPPELGRRLADWGAELLPDGAEISVGRSPAGLRPAPGPRRVLVLGGARSGKSAAAERRLAAEPEVTYVATSRTADLVHPEQPADPEWTARVRAHRDRRPSHWRTVETDDVAGVLAAEPGPLLIDCVSLWLAGQLEAADLAQRVDRLVAAWRGTAAYAVAVSNEVGSGVVPATPSGRRFRDELGRLNARLARESDEVWLVTAGIPQRLR